MRISDWSSDVCSSDLSAAAIVVGDSHPRSVQCQARLGHMDIPGYDDAIGTVLHLYTVSRKIDWRIAVMIFEHLGGCSGPQEDGCPERGTQRKSSKDRKSTRLNSSH